MSKTKRILCIDFDGVIHSYTSQWKGPTIAPDPPVPGALEFLRDASERFTVCIYSSRSQSIGGVECMRSYILSWARLENLDRAKRGVADLPTSWISELQFPEKKPAAYLTIDDRAYCFEGTFPTIEAIENFVPWNRRPEMTRVP